MAIVLTGWESDVVEVAMSVLCSLSSFLASYEHSSPRGSASKLTASVEIVVGLDAWTCWLRSRTSHWSSSQHVSLLLLFDYLEVSICIPWAMRNLSARVSEFAAGASTACANAIQLIPTHLVSPFLHCLDVGLLFQVKIERQLPDAMWKQESIWFPAYAAFLVGMVEASRREDCFRSYNKATSRDLTMFPNPLQVRFVFIDLPLRSPHVSPAFSGLVR